MKNIVREYDSKPDFIKHLSDNDALDICNTLETKMSDEERTRFLKAMKVRFEITEKTHGVAEEVSQVKMANELIKLCSAESLDMQKIEDKYKRIALGSSSRLGSSAFAYMFGTQYFETILPFVENDINKVYGKDVEQAKIVIENYRKMAKESRLNHQQLGE